VNTWDSVKYHLRGIDQQLNYNEHERCLHLSYTSRKVIEMFRSVVCWHFTGAEKRRSLFFKHSPIVPFEQFFLLKGCIITLFHVPYSCIGISRMKSLHWSYRANIWPYKGMLIIHERSPVMAPRIPISFLDLSMAANGAHTHTHTHTRTHTHHYWPWHAL
jgi:hypothetical protein